MWPSLRTHLLEQMTPTDFRNIHTIGNSCRNAFPCLNMAPKLPWYFYQLMEKPLGDYFQVWSPFMMQIIYCIIDMCLYSCFILFCSFTSVSKKQDMERILTLPYSYKWQNFNKMNEKRSLGVSDCGHWICYWDN